jgi:hypothetical protein
MLTILDGSSDADARECRMQEKREIEPSVDRRYFAVSSLWDESDERAYWLARSPGDRLDGLELLRRIFYGDDAATGRLQRLLEVAQLPRS